jgi:hypothetical protein
MELAVVNALHQVFGRGVKIFFCFFHFSQALFRRVQKKSLVHWRDRMFKLSFKRLQALAFVPVKFVVKAFEFIKKEAPKSFDYMISYFERTYIGELVKNSKTIRKSPRFKLEHWNVHDRVLHFLALTNNNVENWHLVVSADQRKKLTFILSLNLIINEQSESENNLRELNRGGVLSRKKNKDLLVKEENVHRLLSEFNSSNSGDWQSLLDGVAKNMGSKFRNTRVACKRNVAEGVIENGESD